MSKLKITSDLPSQKLDRLRRAVKVPGNSTLGVHHRPPLLPLLQLVPWLQLQHHRTNSNEYTTSYLQKIVKSR